MKKACRELRPDEDKLRRIRRDFVRSFIEEHSALEHKMRKASDIGRALIIVLDQQNYRPETVEAAESLLTQKGVKFHNGNIRWDAFDFLEVSFNGNRIWMEKFMVRALEKKLPLDTIENAEMAVTDFLGKMDDEKRYEAGKRKLAELGARMHLYRLFEGNGASVDECVCFARANDLPFDSKEKVEVLFSIFNRAR